MPRSLPRSAVVLIDQGAVSAANFGFLVLAARRLSADDFGLISLVTAGVVSLVGLAQAMNVEPVTVAVSARGRWVSDAERHLVGRRQAAFCVPVATLLAVAGWTAGGRWLLPLLLLAAGLLPAMLVDALRAVDYCNNEPARALRRDLVWIALVGTGLTAAWLAGADHDPAALLAAYLGAGVLVGLPHLPVIGRPAVADDLADGVHRRRFVTEFLTNQGASQLTYYLATAVFGLAVTGSLRAAQSLFGPLNVALSSLRLFLAPDLGRRLVEDPSAASGAWRRLLRWMILASVLAPLAVVLGVGLIGPSLFGPAWSGLVPLVAPFGFQYVWLGVGMAGVLALRATASSRVSMWCRLLQAGLTVAATVAGCWWGHLPGLCWLIASGMAVAGVVWLWAGRRAVRLAVRSRTADDRGLVSA